MQPTADQVQNYVLLADDNLINQRVAKEMLTILGYQVDVANNGLEAVEAFANAAYNAFLQAAKEVKEQGTFTFRENSGPRGEIGRLLKLRAS